MALPTLAGVSAPAFTSDGTKLAVGTSEAIPPPYSPPFGTKPPPTQYNYNALVFGTATRSRVAAYKLSGEVRSLAFSQDGRFLVTAEQDGAGVRSH